MHRKGGWANKLLITITILFKFAALTNFSYKKHHENIAFTPLFIVQRTTSQCGIGGLAVPELIKYIPAEVYSGPVSLTYQSRFTTNTTN